MKAPECKIKQEMPFENIPTYLRRLADALEKKSSGLPAELSDLPEPISKLTLKGKVRDNDWELKIKIKAEPTPFPAPTGTPGIDAPQASENDKPPIKYKKLKKRMKSSFEDIGESLAAQKLPEPDLLNTFLTDSELMTSFPGEKYGEPHYLPYRHACRRLAEAYEAKSWEGLKSAYAALDQLKKDCHREYK